MRIVVVGTSGAGKTTLARRIAALLELPQCDGHELFLELGLRSILL
jgi:adenylate kinase family enzyme